MIRTTTPRPWATLLCAGAILTSMSCGTAGSKAGGYDGPPNIVYIMADDLGYAHLGCYGQKIIRTPHVDRMAAEGMMFTQVYAGCNVCAPCRSVLMTGLHMGHTPVRGNSGGIPIRDTDVTVAEVLKKAGYATGGFGKWGLGDNGTPGVAYKQGFDRFFGYYDQVHAHSYYPRYLWNNGEKFPLKGNDGRDRDGLTGDKRVTYSADEIMRKAREFIRKNRDRPFFCYIPSTVPHTELLVPGDSLKEYAGRFPEPNPWTSPRNHYAAQPQPRAAFAAMVTRLDLEVGRILELLKELDLDRKTIVFFTSDNGGQGGGGPDPGFFEANGPLRGFKGMMTEGGLRVPMVVRWPGRVRPGTVNHLPWYFADVMPTLAELAGASGHVPAGIDGISVAPSILGQDGQKKHEFLYWEKPRFRNGKIRPETLEQAVRMGDWKAIRKRPGAPMELYNLARDLGEATNVADRNPDVVAKIAKIMDREHVDPPIQSEPVPDGINGWRFR